MSSLKRLGAAVFASLMALGTLAMASASANAQSELWRPNPLNSWMANRYHRRYAHKRTAHRRSTTRHATRRRRHR